MDKNELIPDIVARHFAEAPSASFSPNKIQVTEPYSPENISKLFDNYWQHQGHNYNSTYLAGKMMGKSQLDNQNILSDIGKIVEEGLRSGNLKQDITSENLREHFNMLHCVLKVISNDLNAIYVRNNSENDKQQTIDSNEILSLLSGYVVSKVYGG